MAIPTIRRPEEDNWKFEAEKKGMGSLTGADPEMTKALRLDEERRGIVGGAPPTMRPPTGQDDRFRFAGGSPLDPRIRAAQLLKKRLQQSLDSGPQTAEPPRRMT
tara:strand:+ start:4862 stop:5176 length:315 start_codon:yes stop_codon:yes gene_type:complete